MFVRMYYFLNPYFNQLTFKKGDSKRCILELVSKELNHFGVIADSFRQIGGHSSRFVLFCSF